MTVRVSCCCCYWSLMLISDLVMMQGTCPATYHQYNHLHIIEILKSIETFYHCCPFMKVSEMHEIPFSPSSSQEERKIQNRICLLPGLSSSKIVGLDPDTRGLMTPVAGWRATGIKNVCVACLISITQVCDRAKQPAQQPELNTQ